MSMPNPSKTATSDRLFQLMADGVYGGCLAIVCDNVKLRDIRDLRA